VVVVVVRLVVLRTDFAVEKLALVERSGFRLS
jgi:hypothetical protein